MTAEGGGARRRTSDRACAARRGSGLVHLRSRCLRCDGDGGSPTHPLSDVSHFPSHYFCVALCIAAAHAPQRSFGTDPVITATPYVGMSPLKAACAWAKVPVKNAGGQWWLSVFFVLCQHA